MTAAPFSVPISFGALTSTPQISYVNIYQPLNTRGFTNGALFDNLVLDTASGLAPTPEPATLLLVATGVVVAGRRKLRKRL